MTLFQSVSSMRTGTEASLTAISCPVRTVRWWCGTTAAAGVMCHATTTYPTPARRASVSLLHLSCTFSKALFCKILFINHQQDLRSKVVSPFFFHLTASCGEPPKVPNAQVFGKKRLRYETNTKVRYYCEEGFVQKLNPVIKCMPGGQWEEPLITCMPGRCINWLTLMRYHY